MSVPLGVVGQSLRVNFAFGDKQPDGTFIPIDISGYTSCLLKFKPPSPGVASQVIATVDNALTGSGHGNISAATFSVAGDWSFMAEAILASGEVVKTYGTIVRVLAEFVVVI